MNTLNAVAKGVKIFALLTNIPPGQQTVIPRAMLLDAMVPGQDWRTRQTPEFLIDFFQSRLKFHHMLTYHDAEKHWVFYRPREGELLS